MEFSVVFVELSIKRIQNPLSGLRANVFWTQLKVVRREVVFIRVLEKLWPTVPGQVQKLGGTEK